MASGIVDRLDRFQRQHRGTSFPLAVLYKFFDDQGSFLAALITYYGFLSLFPLLLLLASILGFVLEADSGLKQQILDSAVSQFPVLRDELATSSGLPGSGLAVFVGLAVAVYGALGVGQAIQNAMNVMWAVPRHCRPNPLRARLRGLLLLGTGGITVVGTTVLGWMGRILGAYGADLHRGLSLLAVLAAIGLNTAIFALVFRIATAQRLTQGQVWPGAFVAAVLWQLLQIFGAAYVARARGAGTTYGVFVVVLGLLGWIFLASLVVVLSVEINVVRARRLYPRALLTPFTDNVELTLADRRAYGDAAMAQRAKSFQSVEVSFDPAVETSASREAPGAVTPV